jgi:hypothetical protein
MNQFKTLIIGSFGLNLTLLLPGPDAVLILFKEEGFVVTFASPAMDDFMVDLELVGAVKTDYFKLFQF